MGMRTVLFTAARDAWQASASRFGQAHALANARRAATGMSRDRVEREEVRIFLETLGPSEADDATGSRHAAGRAATGSDS
jgi:hypothetical protein